MLSGRCEVVSTIGALARRGLPRTLMSIDEKDPPSSPTLEQLSRYADGFNRSLSLRFLGARLEFPDRARLRGVLEIRPEHRGGLGTSAVNGAIIASMFDFVIGCTPALIDPSRRSATMQLSMSFERPLMGDLLIAEAWIDRAGGKTVFSSARVLDHTGEVCARCQGVVRFSSLPWESGESPAIN